VKTCRLFQITIINKQILETLLLMIISDIARWASMNANFYTAQILP